MSTYAEDQWREIAERAVAQGQSENDFLLSCHVANRRVARRAYIRAAAYHRAVEEEVAALTSAGIAHRQRTIHPITVADLPSAADIDNWHDSESIGDLYYWCQKMRQMLQDAGQDIPSEPLAASPAEAFSGERSES